MQLKAEQMRARTGSTEAHTALIAKMKLSDGVPEIELMLKELTRLEDLIWVQSEPLAFQQPGRSREEVFRFQMAADYGDCWVETTATDGSLLGGFCSTTCA